jgi:hypothetical protein
MSKPEGFKVGHLHMIGADAVSDISYLSDLEKKFTRRALFDQWTERLAVGVMSMLPHLMEWMRRQRFNGHAADDTSGAFDA